MSVRPRPVVLNVHDYPPFSGGGLAIGVQELAEVLRDEFAFRVLSSRPSDHFADDRSRLARSLRGEELVCAPAAPRRTARWLREADVVVLHWTFSFRRLSTLLLLAAPLLGRSTVCVIHTAPDHCDYNRLRLLPTRVRASLLSLGREAARRCTAVIALSPSHAAALEAADFPVSRVLPLPVSSERYGSGESSRAGRRLRTVLILGELSRLKGADAIPGLLRTLTPGFAVHIVGHGPSARRIRSAVAALPPAQRTWVKLLEPVEPAVVPRLYEKADCLLVLSRTESQSRVTLEAMLSGALVLAPPVGGIRDLIADGVNGFVIDPAEPRSVLAVLLRLAADPAEAERVRRRARQGAQAEYARSRREWRRFLFDLTSPPETSRTTTSTARLARGGCAGGAGLARPETAREDAQARGTRDPAALRRLSSPTTAK